MSHSLFYIFKLIVWVSIDLWTMQNTGFKPQSPPKKIFKLIGTIFNFSCLIDRSINFLFSCVKWCSEYVCDLISLVFRSSFQLFFFWKLSLN